MRGQISQSGGNSGAIAAKTAPDAPVFPGVAAFAAGFLFGCLVGMWVSHTRGVLADPPTYRACGALGPNPSLSV